MIANVLGRLVDNATSEATLSWLLEAELSFIDKARLEAKAAREREACSSPHSAVVPASSHGVLCDPNNLEGRVSVQDTFEKIAGLWEELVPRKEDGDAEPIAELTIPPSVRMALFERVAQELQRTMTGQSLCR